MLRRLFSSHGRVARAEYWLSMLAWMVVIATSGFALERFLVVGHPAALATQGVVVAAALLSLSALSARRSHDLGLSYSPFWRRRPFSLLFRRGMAEPNAFGPPPSATRARWLLAALVIGWIALVSLPSILPR